MLSGAGLDLTPEGRGTDWDEHWQWPDVRVAGIQIHVMDLRLAPSCHTGIQARPADQPGRLERPG